MRARRRSSSARSLLVILSLLMMSALARGETVVVLVVGAPGAPEYGSAFAAWADRWSAAAARGSARVITIGRDDPTTSPTTTASTQPATDKARLQATLQQASSDSTDPLWLILIGHGTYDGKDAKFNLRGPDVTDTELAEWLRPLRRPMAIIDCSSASGPFLRRLSAPGRVVITATRSGEEIQFAHFGEYLAAAIADPAADLDKDGQTSLLEAFLAASHKTEEFYKQNGRLMTEHALLDDNGDGLGISADFFQGVRAVRSARSTAPLDGARANQWCLVPSTAERAIPPELRRQRDELELAIEDLRQKKASMNESDYYGQLEPLLLRLARLYQRLDADAPTTR
jgi:hypothetical protein